MVMQAEKREGVMCVELEGPRLDAASAGAVKSGLRDLIDGGEDHIVIDFRHVQFMDSSGLGALVGCLKYMGASGKLELACPGDAVMKVLRLTRMDRIFTVRDLPVAG